MTDLTYTGVGTFRRNATDAVPGNGIAYSKKTQMSTVEISAGAANRTYKMARVPSRARLCASSTVYWDDLATAGSPTLDIGAGSVDSNITSDADAINDGLALSSAGSNRVVKDFANLGKQAWEYVSGQTSDPGGDIDIYVSILDAATTTAGTVALELNYVVD